MTSEDAISGQIDAWHAKIRAERWFTLDPWRLTDSPYCSNEPAHVGGRPSGQTVKPVLAGFCYVCNEQSAAPGRRRCHKCNMRHWKAMKRARRKAALASGE
jgi:hypothetical protein